MSNKLSRRSFLKCTGASVAALGAAALLGGCQTNRNGAVNVSVKVGDKISNWNNLGVQLTRVFQLTATPDVEGYEYVAVLVTAVNRSTDTTFNIGAQDLDAINAAYPLDDEATKAANAIAYFHALADSTTDFAVLCDGQTVEGGAYVSLYDDATETFSDSNCLPPQRSGYIELVCLVPKGWRELAVTYTPAFVSGKQLTFTMSASDIAKAE